MTKVHEDTKEILRDVVQWVESQEKLNPKDREWRQEFWASRDKCGTTYCVAGYIVKKYLELDRFYYRCGEKVCEEYVDTEGKLQDISSSAESILCRYGDVSRRLVYRLFYCYASPENIRDVSEEIVGEKL